MDEAERIREYRREMAFNLVKSWAAPILAAYEEPKRRGVPKGDGIGSSKKQKAASLYLAAYPYCSCSLREIARLAGTTEGSLKVWRTQGAFLDNCHQAFDDLAQYICRTIDIAMRIFAMGHAKSAAEIRALHSERPRGRVIGTLGPYEIFENPIGFVRLLIDLVPFLNDEIFRTVHDFIVEKFNENISGYTALFMLLRQSVEITDQDSRRNSHVKWLDVTKTYLSVRYDNLMAPEAWTPENAEKSKENAAYLKESIFALLDILAGVNTKAGRGEADGSKDSKSQKTV